MPERQPTSKLDLLRNARIADIEGELDFSQIYSDFILILEELKFAESAEINFGENVQLFNEFLLGLNLSQIPDPSTNIEALLYSTGNSNGNYSLQPGYRGYEILSIFDELSISESLQAITAGQWNMNNSWSLSSNSSSVRFRTSSNSSYLITAQLKQYPNPIYPEWDQDHTRTVMSSLSVPDKINLFAQGLKREEQQDRMIYPWNEYSISIANIPSINKDIKSPPIKIQGKKAWMIVDGRLIKKSI